MERETVDSIRKDLGLSYQDIAEKVDRSTSTVGRWFEDRSIPFDSFFALAEALGMRLVADGYQIIPPDHVCMPLEDFEALVRAAHKHTLKLIADVDRRKAKMRARNNG